MRVLALLLFVAVMILGRGVAALPPQKLCYFMMYGADDLGWTFAFNVGRVQTHAALRTLFPSVELESVAVPNVGPLVFSGADVFAYVQSWVQRGCTVFITNNGALLGNDTVMTQIMTTYSNISFIPLRDNTYETLQFPNRFPITFDFSLGYYLAGVAVATQGVKRCVGFNAAWETSPNPVEALNGFLMGLRSVDPTIKVEVVTMNSWSSPDEEVRAAQLLLKERGCDRIARYSDPRDVNVDVEGLGNSSLFSMGPHSDLQQYVGDTVLISVYSQWSTFLIPLISDLFSTGRFDFTRPTVQTINTGGLTVSQVTPLAARGVQEAVIAARARLATATGAMCGPATYTFTDGSNITLPDASTCYNGKYRSVPFLKLPNVVYHGAWQTASLCPAGSMATYATQPLIALKCVVCPPNTFTSSAGQPSCSACPSGLISGTNATRCTLPESSGSNSSTVGGVAGGLGAVLVMAVCVVFILRAKNAKRNVNAPRSAPLALLFTDVESSTHLWQAYPKSMSAAMLTHHAVIRRVIDENGAYEVKTVGDSFMIATRTALDGVFLATEIQRQLNAAEWPSEFRFDENWNGLKVRIGVHYCQDVEVRFETLHNYYDYYGNDVNLSARVESVARGGQILMTKETYDQIRSDEDFAALRSDIEVSVYAHQVILKGLEEEFTLFSVVPVELAGREFEPMEGHENDHANPEKAGDSVGGSFEVKRSASASSLSTVSSVGGAGLPATLVRALRIVFEGIPRTSSRKVFKEFMGVDAGSRNVSRMAGLMARAIASRMAGHEGGAAARTPSNDSATQSPVTAFLPEADRPR